MAGSLDLEALSEAARRSGAAASASASDRAR